MIWDIAMVNRISSLDEFIVYDIENNQSKKIVGPAEILGSIGGASAIFNSTIFIPSQSANGVEVNQYDIENDKWGDKTNI